MILLDTNIFIFGDSILLKEAEEHEVEVIVTWNKKHFMDRTKVRVQTPGEFLKKVI